MASFVGVKAEATHFSIFNASLEGVRHFPRGFVVAKRGWGEDLRLRLSAGFRPALDMAADQRQVCLGQIGQAIARK